MTDDPPGWSVATSTGGSFWVVRPGGPDALVEELGGLVPELSEGLAAPVLGGQRVVAGESPPDELHAYAAPQPLELTAAGLTRCRCVLTRQNDHL